MEPFEDIVAAYQERNGYVISPEQLEICKFVYEQFSTSGSGSRAEPRNLGNRQCTTGSKLCGVLLTLGASD